MKYVISPSATYALNCASVGELSLPVNPPIAITAVSVDSTYSAAVCEPTVAADQRVVVWFSRLVRSGRARWFRSSRPRSYRA